MASAISRNNHVDVISHVHVYDPNVLFTVKRVKSAFFEQIYRERFSGIELADFFFREVVTFPSALLIVAIQEVIQDIFGQRAELFFIDRLERIKILRSETALNRYSYTLNNPLKFTDPTGNVPVDLEDSTDDHMIETSSYEVIKTSETLSGKNGAFDAGGNAAPGGGSGFQGTGTGTDTAGNGSIASRPPDAKSKHQELIDKYKKADQGWWEHAYATGGFHPVVPRSKPPSTYELRKAAFEDAGYSPIQAAALAGTMNVAGGRFFEGLAGVDVAEMWPIEGMERAAYGVAGGADLGFKYIALRTAAQSFKSAPTAPRTELPKSGADAQRVVGNKITGFTRHGIHRTIERGVKPGATLNTLRSPTKTVSQTGGTTMYIGKSATIITNSSGKVVTAWRK